MSAWKTAAAIRDALRLAGHDAEVKVVVAGEYGVTVGHARVVFVTDERITWNARLEDGAWKEAA